MVRKIVEGVRQCGIIISGDAPAHEWLKKDREHDR
jgi:hypothetical protein